MHDPPHNTCVCPSFLDAIHILQLIWLSLVLIFIYLFILFLRQLPSASFYNQQERRCTMLTSWHIITSSMISKATETGPLIADELFVMQHPKRDGTLRHSATGGTICDAASKGVADFATGMFSVKK